MMDIKYIELKTGYNDDGPAWIGKGKIIIDSKIISEYLEIIGEKELNKTKFIVERIEDVFPVERINAILNQ